MNRQDKSRGGLAVHRGACGFTGHHGLSEIQLKKMESGGSISLPPDSPHASPPDSLVPSPSPRPPTSPPSLSPSNPPLDSKPPVHHPARWPSPASTSSQNVPQSFNSKHHTIWIWLDFQDVISGIVPSFYIDDLLCWGDEYDLILFRSARFLGYEL
ncbi:hypothetical protein LOK49_LG08G01529 [Camellia lanceoleosa]|uniref:Uncharacterized protein n=1 Tax=Camellia lanceoleosa TaxID=1840588 RepID=A0ACC0GUB2_9ERIC|nr:hypothetical protein LOK49_LG08G01529 [Camellia lanceoleosa]